MHTESEGWPVWSDQTDELLLLVQMEKSGEAFNYWLWNHLQLMSVVFRASKSWPQGTIYPSRIIKESHWFCLTSSRCTRKVTLLPRLAVSFPSFVVSRSPFGGRMGHCCFIAVYISFTPLVQLFNTTLRYLWNESGNNFTWANGVWKNCSFVVFLKYNIVHTLCCWNSSDPDCSLWRPWND